jgi:phosphatidylinositol-3-phosphatase
MFARMTTLPRNPHQHPHIAVSLVLALAVLAGCGGGSSAPEGICGTRGAPPATYDHVVWIWMENHSYGQIIGSDAAPYINQLASSCGSATNFHNITHVSLPNYIGATTGLPLASLMPFIFDCSPGANCVTDSDSLFAQVKSWKAYQESMSDNCQQTGLVGYAVRHNPPAYLTSLSGCETFDVPYPQLAQDLGNGGLPAFSFITPNTVHDMHDGKDPQSIQAGDEWLVQNLPDLLNSDPYRKQNTAIFITFDEGEGDAFGEDCAANPDDESCHIATIVISPYVTPGTTSDALFTHYSLLRTTEEMLGISQYLGEAAGAASMRSAFHL